MHRPPREPPTTTAATILLVDDHPPNLVALEAVLAPLGHRLVRATSGEEALGCLLREDVTVILLDVQMPGLDGFETAALIKQRARNRDTPIVFLTAAQHDDAQVFKAYAHGAVDFVTKPFDAAVLRAKVAAFVELARRGGPARPDTIDGDDDAPREAPAVWLLDDSALEAEITRRILAARYRVEVFADGATLLERFAERAEPCALVLDWHLPGLSGVEVCRFIRETHNPGAMPILVLTAARGDAADVATAIEAGANDFVSKPCPPVELLARVESMLRIRRLHDRAERTERELRTQRDYHREATWFTEALHRVTLALAADLDVDASVERLAVEAAALCHADVGAFVAAAPGLTERSVVARAASGEPVDAARVVGSPAVAAIVEAARARRAPQRVGDTTRAPRGGADAPGAASAGDLRSVLAVPVVARSGETLGVLLVGHAATAVFTPQNERLLATVAAQASAALDNARLYAEARRQRAALQVSEERLRLALAASDAGAWDYDPAALRVDWDARSADLLGVPAAASIAYEAFLARVHPDDRAGVQAAMERALDPAHGGHYRAEFRVAGDDPGAPPRWIAAQARATFDAAGRPVRLTGTVVDATARRRAEDEAAARAAFERQLLGIVSHDLRNPLNAIQGSAQLLLARGADPRDAPALKRIAASAERATRMVHDLLDFTRVRLTGALPIAPARVDLAELAGHIVDEARAAHPERAIAYESCGECQGEWDADRVAQVLANLLANALAYSPPATPVRVATRAEADGVVLEVRNGGPAISAARLARLFEPMERGDVPATSATRSVGLGLYIVDHIVRAHGGTIEVRSTDADGTTFTVRLPRTSRPSLVSPSS